MKRILRSSLAAAIAVIGLLAPVTPAVQAAGGVMLPSVGTHPHAVLAKEDATAHFACQDRHLDDPSGRPACYDPASIRAAYDIQPLLNHGDTGRGRTIVIVDAFSNPFITTDLQLFDAAFGLPDPVFNIIAPDGVPPFDINDANQVGWSSEISLDVEWAHAVAPAAHILLVLAKSNNDDDLNHATKYAVDHNLGDVISQSFGEGETCAAPKDVQNLHAIYQKATARNITLLASSGDQGAAGTCDGVTFFGPTPSWPAVDPLVTSVGGTNLQANLTTGAYEWERAWSDAFSGCFPTDQFGCSGGGFSNIYSRPAYQSGIHGTRAGHRGVPDVAYNAGVDGGVLTHWGVGLATLGIDPATPGAFFIFGGTSAGSPQWAGLVALADQLRHRRVGMINDTLYNVSRSRSFYRLAFHDIKTGNNNFQSIVGYQAATGWDPVTGLGSPNALVLVPVIASH